LKTRSSGHTRLEHLQSRSWWEPDLAVLPSARILLSLLASSQEQRVPAIWQAQGSIPFQEWGVQGWAEHPTILGPTPTGLFVYPLDEYTTVIGFEAVIADRIVTVQIKDKAKLESGHSEVSRVQPATVTGKEIQRAMEGHPTGLRSPEMASMTLGQS
jgi:hypothetical protein